MKRLREHAALFAAILAVVALVSGLTVGVIGLVGQSADEGVREGLATRTSAALALRASLALSPDAAVQDAEVRAAIARSMPGIPIAVTRALDSRADVAEVIDGAAAPERRSLITSIADLPERAKIVDGEWPSGPNQVSVQFFAAERLQLQPGDTVRIEGYEATVAGTWRAGDALDPRWLGDVTVTEGVSDVVFGPIVIDESLWPELDTVPRARWTLVPDSTRLKAADLLAIVTAWDAIETDWREEVSSQFNTLEKQGGFKRSALELGTRVDGLQAVQPIALLLLVAIALVTLAELGRLLTATRSTEIALLWSRGASAHDFGRSTAVEAALIAGVGASAGTGAALGALAMTVGPEALGAVGSTVWIAPVAFTAAAALIVAGSAFRSAVRQTVRDPSDASGRGRRLVGPGTVALSAAAAALAVWQLQLYGSPLTPTADGGTDVDPISALAPALTLVAVVILALVLFPRVARITELATARAPAVRVLAARDLARRLQFVAAPIVVVAVAAATLVVASGYASTWSESFERTSQLQTGAALHISTGAPGLTDATIESIAAVPGVNRIAPIDLETFLVGSASGSIVASTPTAFAQLATTANGTFDREAISEEIDAGVPGAVLPAGTTALALTTEQLGFGEIPAVGVQLMDGYGVLRTVQFDAGVASGADAANSSDGFASISYLTELPPAVLDAPEPWRLLAVDISMGQEALVGDATGSFVLSELAVTADSVGIPLELDGYWLPETPPLQFAAPIPGYGGLGFTIGAESRDIRMTPTFDGSVADVSSPPAVISRQLADRFDLGAGDSFSFDLDGSDNPITCVIARVVPAIPGAPFESAVLIDRGVVVHYGLRRPDLPSRSQEFWIDTDDPAAVDRALRSELPANARTRISGDPAGRTVLGSASTALWLGAAWCVILAIITVIAVVRAQLRGRRNEVILLRAVGLGSRDQGSVRRREVAFVLAFGGITGLVAGFAVSVLTVPQLARAAVIEPYSTVPTPLGFDLVGLGIGVGALTVCLLAIVGVYTARVSAQARVLIGADEAR